jgi:hypothetical protein
MLITYVKMAIAAAMMLAQPVQHGYDRGQVSVGVAVVSSRDVSSTPAQPASSQSSPREVARREVAIRGEKTKPAAHARAAKQVAAHPREVPRAKIANLHPAGSAAAGSDTKRAKNGIRVPQPVPLRRFQQRNRKLTTPTVPIVRKLRAATPKRPQPGRRTTLIVWSRFSWPARKSNRYRIWPARALRSMTGNPHPAPVFGPRSRPRERPESS